MTAATDPVALLERAVSFTRGALASVTDDSLSRRTPCRDWLLRDLLDHMADGLDAFTEASSGVIDVDVVHPVGAPVHVLREKACALLGAWSSPAAATIRLDDAEMDSDLLLHAGALEMTVHGWDVGRATGLDSSIPQALAADLMPTARALIGPGDRGVRFAEPLRPTDGAGDDARLLALLGRAPE